MKPGNRGNAAVPIPSGNTWQMRHTLFDDLPFLSERLFLLQRWIETEVHHEL